MTTPKLIRNVYLARRHDGTYYIGDDELMTEVDPNDLIGAFEPNEAFDDCDRMFFATILAKPEYIEAYEANEAVQLVGCDQCGELKENLFKSCTCSSIPIIISDSVERWEIVRQAASSRSSCLVTAATESSNRLRDRLPPEDQLPPPGGLGSPTAIGDALPLPRFDVRQETQVVTSPTLTI